MTAKKQAAKPSPTPTKRNPSTQKPKPKVEIVKHPFGTCVPLGECACNTKGEN